MYCSASAVMWDIWLLLICPRLVTTTQLAPRLVLLATRELLLCHISMLSGDLPTWVEGKVLYVDVRH